MDEEQVLMLHEVSYLLGNMRKVCEEAAVIRTKYRGFEIRGTGEKNGTPAEKNWAIMKKILNELDGLQDSVVLSRVQIKRLCKQLEPEVLM